MRNLFKATLSASIIILFFGALCFAQKTDKGILFIEDFGNVKYYQALEASMKTLGQKYHIGRVGKLEGYRELKLVVREMEKNLVNEIILMPAVLAENDPFLGSVDYVFNTGAPKQPIRDRDYKKIKTDIKIKRTEILGHYDDVFEGNIKRLISNLTINPKRPQDYVIIIIANSTFYKSIDAGLQKEINVVAKNIEDKYKIDSVGYVLPQRPSYRLNSTGAKKIKNEISVKYHGKKIIFLGFSFEQLWLRKQSKKLATFATWGGYADVNQSKILSWVNSNLEEKIQIEKSDKTEGELQYDNRSENYRQNIR